MICLKIAEVFGLFSFCCYSISFSMLLLILIFGITDWFSLLWEPYPSWFKICSIVQYLGTLKYRSRYMCIQNGLHIDPQCPRRAVWRQLSNKRPLDSHCIFVPAAFIILKYAANSPLWFRGLLFYFARSWIVTIETALFVKCFLFPLGGSKNGHCLNVLRLRLLCNAGKMWNTCDLSFCSLFLF